MLVVDIPDPLGDIGQPALAALLLDQPDEVGVGELVQAAEDLAYHADQGARPLEARRHGAKPVASRRHRPHRRGEPLLVRHVAQRQRLAGVAQGVEVGLIGGARLELIGPRTQQHLHERVVGHDGSPGRADEVLRVLADRRISVVGGDGEDRHIGVAEVVERAADQVTVLAKAAGSVGLGHEKGDIVASDVVEHAQKVAHRDLLRIALLTRGDLAAQLESALVGVRRRPAVEADRADGGRQEVRAAVGHVRQVQRAPLEAEIADRLDDPGVGRRGRRRAAAIARHHE